MERKLQLIIGQNLRRYRAAQNITQEDCAFRVGIDRAYFGSIERGERNLSLQKVEFLADRLGVDPLDLLQVDVEFLPREEG